MTLAELLVGSVVSMIVMAALSMGYVSSLQAFTRDDDEARGLADVRKVVERLGRDVRQARSIGLGADAHHLVMWIDANSDYVKQPHEVVTWQLQADSSDPGHFDVLRTAAGGTTYRQATTLVSDIAFCYKRSEAAACMSMPLTTADVSNVRVVHTSMQYDPLLARGAQERGLSFATRLRNVE